MPEVEIIKMITKDVETNTTFNVYPEGEVGWVTYFRPSYDYAHNIDLLFTLRNNTDTFVMANFRIYNPYVEAGLYDIPIDAHGEYSDKFTNILASALIGKMPVTFTAEAWIEGGGKHTVNFTVDEGNFLWISSELQCRVEIISGELKYQRPEEGLYIFPHNAPVSLHVIPPFCHLFKNWVLEWKRSGTSETKVENPVEFTLTENCSATIYFEPAS